MPVVQKLRCQVETIINYGDHVYTIELRPDRPVPKFLPGQFLHLALDEYDPSGFWPDSRVFSIASSPARREHLRISYSVRGRFTARMEREIREGSRLWVKLPYGDFVIQDRSDVVLFAGGTGITAFTSFLDGLTPQFRHRVYLAYGARRKSLLLYRGLVQEKARTVPQFRPLFFLEEKGDGGKAESEEEKIGRVSVESIWPELEDPGRTIYYLSGPPAMLKAISQDLRERGISLESIQVDAWE
jgi:ferredoxin-NADP reductase